jgi:hypothetical protein
VRDSAPSTHPAQTSTRLSEEARAGTQAQVCVQLPSAKDQGSARSFSRSSKLCPLTALINHFTTVWRELSAQNYYCLQVKRLRKQIYHVQGCDVVTGL